ncbi:MAG: class I SAM-dependent methyltransferase [Bacteroidia bacterium]
MKCLLCASQNTFVKGSYRRRDLARLWDFMDISGELILEKIEVHQCKNCSLIFFDPRLAGQDKFYSELGKFEWYYMHDGKSEYDYVQKFIKQGHKILDIGAGRGVLYTRITEKVDYTGLELSTKAVELAKASGINVQKEDLAKHAQTNKGTYDMVCLFQVLEHLTELDDFLKNVNLTLKKNGLFVIAVPDNDGFISYSSNYVFNLPPHHTILWTESSLRFLAKKFNFKVVEIEREQMQAVHFEVASQSYLVAKLSKLFFVSNRLIDNRRSYKLVLKIAGKLYSMTFFKKLFLPRIRKKLQKGQSIIITLEKI